MEVPGSRRSCEDPNEENRVESGQTPGSTAGIGAPPRGRRKRRPTGAAPPLPKIIGWTGKLWLAAVLVIVVSGTLWLVFTTGPLDRIDAVFIRVVTSARTPWLDSLTRGLYSVGSRWGLAILGLLTVALAAMFRRWRQLIVFLVSLAVLDLLSPFLYGLAARPRPFSVTAIGHWEGYSSPSEPIAALTAILLGVTYMLVVPGRPRWYAKVSIALIVVAVGLVRIYLGIDHPSDIVFAAILGVAIPLALFRAFAPNDAFPVAYGKRGKSAHLDVGGRRGEAIRRAMQEQLGLTILEMKLVGLEGSGGSTPLKLQVVDEQGAERSVFAKLYARNHVRADRWYKLVGRCCTGDSRMRRRSSRSAGSLSTRTTHSASWASTAFPRLRRSASSRSRQSAST
jgi:membrane-associated phospholipid phosphatase